MDFDSFFRNWMESILIRASWVQDLQSLLGLNRVSQVWGGRAEWCFWLQSSPGVYALVFADGGFLSWRGPRLYEGRFILKCYPYPEQPAFEGFSPEERRLVKSDRFDPTNTPKFEGPEIPDTLFTIGSVSLLLDPEQTVCLLSFESLDTFKTIRKDTTAGAGGGQVVRDVAGRRLGYPIFDALVGLYSHFRRESPIFLGVTTSPGFEHALLSDETVLCVDSERSSLTRMTVGFHRNKDEGHSVETLWREGLEEGEEVIACRTLSSSIGDISFLPEIAAREPRWWEISCSDFRSELHSTCGCGDHHCRGCP